VGLVGAALHDPGHLPDGEAELVVGREEVRPEPEAGVRPEVAHNVTGGELPMNGLEVRCAEDDRPAAAIRVARARQLEAGAVEELDQERGLCPRALADPLDADLFDQVVACCRGVEGGDVGRPGEEPRRAVREVHLGLERERPRVRLPAREPRLEPVGQVGPHVEPARARPAAQPLDASADGEVDAERRHVERNGAGRLVGVEQDVGACVVRSRDDRLDVLDLTGLVEDVADRDEQGALVDRLDDRGVVLADDDLGAEPRLGLLDVADRGEEPLLEDDPVPRAAEVEAREDDRLGDRDVLVHHRRPGRRADDPADLVADGDGRLPPALAPSADPARRPLVGVAAEAVGRLGGHRPERVVDEVRRLGEDREPLAVRRQLHGPSLRPRRLGPRPVPGTGHGPAGRRRKGQWARSHSCAEEALATTPGGVLFGQVRCQAPDTSSRAKSCRSCAGFVTANPAEHAAQGRTTACTSPPFGERCP
jgi:hypothetical protein